MAGREFNATISINGQVDASVIRAVADISGELETLQRTALESASATDRLSATIDLQSDELKKAQRAYQDYILSGEQSSEQAQELKEKIEQLANELGNNKRKLSDAEEAAENLAGELADTGDAAADTSDGFTVMKGAMADLVADGISSLIGSCVDAVKSIGSLSAETQEYREDMSKLQTAFTTMGHTTEEGTEVYKELFSVFGEEDRAVEAAQQIAALADNEAEMVRMTNIATGIWGRWGDALPAEAAMEAVNATAKIGTVQGNLADALEWSGVNLDDFNKALEGMNSEEERSEYILKTLEGLYGTAADNYRETNASIIESRRATSDNTDALAKAGETLEPLMTQFTLFKTELLVGLMPAIQGITTALMDSLTWMRENEGAVIAIAAIVGYLTTVLLIHKAVKAIKLAMDAAEVTSVWGLVAANWSLFASEMAVLWPILLIVAAIAAVIAIVILCIKYWDKIKAAAMSAVDWIVGAWNTVATWFNDNVIQPIVGFFVGLWNGIVGIFQSVIDWVKTNWKSILLFIVNPFAGVFSYLYNNFDGFRNFIDNFIQKITDGFKNMVNGIKNFFVNGFQSLAGIIKQPINAVISIINGAIDGINSIGFDIPEWVPVIGGQKFALDIPKLPMLATGGFTEGISIAGEKGVEAVISFDPAYRDENISYWAKAGRMLGVDSSDFFLGVGGGTGTTIDLGGITFAPNITITGNANKSDIIKAIEDEYPEFLDMLEEYLIERGNVVYA